MASNYGTDVSIFTDWRTQMRAVSGGRAVVESCIKRLMGRLFHNDDYGFPLLDQLNSNFGPGDALVLESNIEKELAKDDRVDEVDATVTSEGLGSLDFTITVALTLADDLGSFELIIPINDGAFSVASLRIAETF